MTEVDDLPRYRKYSPKDVRRKSAIYGVNVCLSNISSSAIEMLKESEGRQNDILSTANSDELCVCVSKFIMEARDILE